MAVVTSSARPLAARCLRTDGRPAAAYLPLIRSGSSGHTACPRAMTSSSKPATFLTVAQYPNEHSLVPRSEPAAPWPTRVVTSHPRWGGQRPLNIGVHVDSPRPCRHLRIDPCFRPNCFPRWRRAALRSWYAAFLDRFAQRLRATSRAYCRRSHLTGGQAQRGMKSPSGECDSVPWLT